MLRELAVRLGYGEYYPWRDEEASIDAVLQPLGPKVADLKAQPNGMFYGTPLEFRSYERYGFRTPSGKVELRSSVLASYGYDPLPAFREPAESPVRTPELASRYPLVLNAGYRVAGYTHSRYRNLPGLRRRNPEPLAELHPETAERYGIADRDWVVVETPRGRIELRAWVTDAFVTGTVGLLHGWEEANANLLTEDRHTDPVFATPALRSILCCVRRAEDQREPLRS